MSTQTKQFYLKINEMSREFSVNPEDLLLVLYMESGINPSSKNPLGGAVGINQFYGKTFDEYVGSEGVTRKEYASYSADEQLPFVEKFFRDTIGGRKNLNATKLYIANFLPAALNMRGVISENRDTILGESGSQKIIFGIKSDLIYSQNKGLDYNRDGKITYGDIADVCDAARRKPGFQKHLEKLKAAVSGTWSEKDDPAPSEETTSKEDSSEGGPVARFIKIMVDSMKSAIDILS